MLGVVLRNVWKPHLASPTCYNNPFQFPVDVFEEQQCLFGIAHVVNIFRGPVLPRLHRIQGSVAVARYGFQFIVRSYMQISTRRGYFNKFTAFLVSVTGSGFYLRSKPRLPAHHLARRETRRGAVATPRTESITFQGQAPTMATRATITFS